MATVASIDGACSSQEGLLLPSVSSRSTLSRWALVPSPARADRREHEAATPVEEVVVRHTFLSVASTPEVTPKRRATSAPPPPDSCDREADIIRALTYKPRPVDTPGKEVKARCSTRRSEEGEESQTESTATGDVDSASASVSEDIIDRYSLPGLLTGDSNLTPGDFLQRACALANGSYTSEWQQSHSDWHQYQGATSLTEGGADETHIVPRNVPRDARGVPTSIGSIGHLQGVCKPCVFAHHSSKVCQNGIACPFCHFEHPPKQKRRLTGRQRHLG